MERQKYDAIIIGAGHNGMALSVYLGKSGWDVLVVERRLEEGGGLNTEHYTRPGFLHNLHSNYHTFVGLCPVYDDLGLVGEPDGVKYAYPPVQMGSIFEDGTALTIHGDMSKTHASMARFSKKDADTFQRLYKEVKGFQDLMISTLMYAPPIDVNDITKALSTWKVEEKTEFFRARLRSMSINDFLDKHFEHDRIKAMLAFHGTVCGYYTDMVGLAISFPFMLGKIDNWRLCIGGSHRLAHTLWRQMRRNNVTLRMASPVEEIIVDNGRAVGVRTSDGKEFFAEKLVASSLDLEQTFKKMLPGDILPADIEKDIGSYEYQDGTLFSVHMAMNKIPTYKAAKFDPDINQAWVLNMGYECLEDFNNDFKDIRNGAPPKDPKLNVAINSLFDPTDAPEGKATGVIRVLVPYSVNNKGPGIWASNFKTAYANRCIRKMEKYCDNFDADKDIIQAKPYTPLDISEKLTNMVRGDWMVGRISEENLMGNRPTPLMSQYRTPVKGLYLCGSTTHPHGFITFGPGYNALQVIADDFGLEKWWVEI
jgi:phytoene dehydrogenase-like protein